MERFVVISGCSGGGKSTVLRAMAERGYAVVEEPGRRIIAEQLMARRNDALPWIDLEAFAGRALELARADWERQRPAADWVFFDRGLVDAAAALEHATPNSQVDRLCRDERYHPMVFMAPPWPEIFATDEARRHGLREAIAEYKRLLAAYTRLGYSVEILPKAGVADRCDFILDRLGS